MLRPGKITILTGKIPLPRDIFFKAPAASNTQPDGELFDCTVCIMAHFLLVIVLDLQGIAG
jgi:hypothetical protein